jgi:hypothetical protein
VTNSSWGQKPEDPDEQEDFGECEHCFICHDPLGGAGFGGDNVVVVVVVRHDREYV